MKDYHQRVEGREERGGGEKRREEERRLAHSLVDSGLARSGLVVLSAALSSSLSFLSLSIESEANKPEGGMNGQTAAAGRIDSQTD